MTSSHDSTHFTIEDIHALLALRGQIADIWSIEDVLSQCDWLTDSEAWNVLLAMKRRSSPGLGISWNDIYETAEELYPQLID